MKDECGAALREGGRRKAEGAWPGAPDVNLVLPVASPFRILAGMNRSRTLSFRLTIVILVVAVRGTSALDMKTPASEPMQPGKFQPTWDSLKQYECPDWFRDAKFGIWAHWGPQCQPEQGDWYARAMYETGSQQNKWHVAHYGDPSKFGFKDVIHEWQAEHWNPGRLMALYKRAGAQYFFALANHHDNFDTYDSRYQPWNSVNIGPKKDLIAGWAQAARANGLKFGVSVHAARAWSWYEPAQKFDGNLTKADGKGLWWEGLDPQDLYAQRHTPGTKLEWDWDAAKGSSVPDAAYCEKFYNRTVDLINKYRPDLIYFDDTALPLWPISDAGLRIAAHFYNRIPAGVLFGKVLTEEQRHCMTWDIERGASNRIEPLPWQTDTCIGSWHYDRSHFEKHNYKSTKTVIHTLADVVSKNGNLLLSIPVRGDGTIDADEVKIVEGIAAWMDVNRECIFGTRPWKVFGEGPASEGAPIQAQGFNEGKGKATTVEDIRFTKKGNTLYAIVLGKPTKPVVIKSLAGEKIASITLLGSNEKIRWSKAADALTMEPPQKTPSDIAIVFKIQ
jgi:alpha-L-fucosidase